MELYASIVRTLGKYSHFISFSSKKGSNYGGIVPTRRRSSFIVTPYGDYHKTTLEYVLPLLLLPLLLGRQGLLTAWVIYQYPLDPIFQYFRSKWSHSSPQLWEKFKSSIDRLETKFLNSSTSNILNQILFFTLAEKYFALDQRTSLYSLIFYNFFIYSIRYCKELRLRGQETWATVTISNTTNIQHLAMSATKLVLEWTKFVTFIATVVTFLIVLHLDSSASTSKMFPPLTYTLLTLFYYICTEEHRPMTLKLPSQFAFEEIQGLEPLYLAMVGCGLTIGLNLGLILFLIPSLNVKLCLLGIYHNVYLQYRQFQRLKRSINEEWERISGFRIAGAIELKDLDDLCTVCLGPLTQYDVRVTNCHHFFHANCLRLYLKQSQLDSCPICKRNLFDC